MLPEREVLKTALTYTVEVEKHKHTHFSLKQDEVIQRTSF